MIRASKPVVSPPPAPATRTPITKGELKKMMSGERSDLERLRQLGKRSAPRR